ncbi:ornithine decarboxylase, constitutive, partial [Escherichia coli 93.0056]
LYGYVLK